MSASIPVTRADLGLLQSLRSLALVQPERRRAAHLVARCDELIARVEAAACKECLQVPDAYADAAADPEYMAEERARARVWDVTAGDGLGASDE